MTWMVATIEQFSTIERLSTAACSSKGMTVGISEKATACSLLQPRSTFHSIPEMASFEKL